MKKKLSIILLLLFVSTSVSSLIAGEKGVVVGCKDDGVCRLGDGIRNYAPVVF